MTTPPERARELWQTLQLQSAPGDFSIPTITFDLDTGQGNVRLARSEDGSPRLLVPVGDLRQIDDSLSGMAIEVAPTRLVVGGRTRPFLQVACRQNHLEDAFLTLIDDVVHRLHTGMGPEQAITSAIAEHRELLRRGAGPSIEFLAGLFGELHVLEQLQRHSDDAAKAWTGPLGQKHDFSGLGSSAEVKSTLAREGYVVRISSLDQLDAPNDGRSLYLVCVHLERSGSSGRSVSDLIAAVRVETAARVFIDRALAALDCGNWQRMESLISERFQVIRQTIYEVRSGFPCIGAHSFVPGAPPLGVQKLTYDLDLRHADGFRLNPDESEHVLAKLACPS